MIEVCYTLLFVGTRDPYNDPLNLSITSLYNPYLIQTTRVPFFNCPTVCFCEMYYSTLPETNSSHLKIRQNPKGNDRLPIIHFQMRKLLVSGSLIEFTFQVSGIHPMRCVATIPPSDRPIKSIGAGQGQGR